MSAELVRYQPAPAPLIPLALRRLGLAAVLTGTWGVAVFVAAHVEADPALHRGALFLHLASLVLGLGAVLRGD
jgi:hypothetical protein